MDSQAFQVLLGAFVALFYAVAVVGIGQSLLLLFSCRETRGSMRQRLGWFGVVWCCFVIGQGILGMVWLTLSLLGVLYSWLIWSVSIAGWCIVCGLSLVFRRQVVMEFKSIRTKVFLWLQTPSWYFCVGAAIVCLSMLFGLLALLPTQVDDALARYLVVAKSVANSQKLDFQPFATPFYGLLPLQIEMHWAALFAISNETAVTVWDYFSALSFLVGIALLAWALTSSRPVGLLALIMMLSTPAFYATIGGAKPDNAGSQYGMAAFLALVLLPGLRRQSIILAGLCAGWALASRYTNVIILPALFVFAFTFTRKGWQRFSGSEVHEPARIFTATNIVVAGLAVAFGFAPMLIKNWILVGCPLAPHFGCQGMFWADIYAIAHSGRQNISLADLFFYPFIWTFASRDDMLGNISPLFVGFFPFLLVSRSSTMARSGLIAGLTGLVSLATWLAIHPLLLYTRWLLVPLALLAIPLSASVIDVEHRLGHNGAVRWLIRTGIGIIIFFLLFQSRGVVHAVRYVTSVDDRPARYHLKPGYDVSTWLNSYVEPGERVALRQWPGYRYFVNPTILLRTESAEELQTLWDSVKLFSASWTPDLWQFYVKNGFSYVVVPENSVSEALSAWPDIPTNGLTIAFQGQKDLVLRIEKKLR